MLPKPFRLSRQGFESARGLKRITTPHFSVSYGTTSGAGGSAVIVPKKAVKSAVGRHLLKRRIRHILRAWSAKDRICIVTARTGSTTLTFNQINDELTPVLNGILS